MHYPESPKVTMCGTNDLNLIYMLCSVKSIRSYHLVNVRWNKGDLMPYKINHVTSSSLFGSDLLAPDWIRARPLGDICWWWSCSWSCCCNCCCCCEVSFSCFCFSSRIRACALAHKAAELLIPLKADKRLSEPLSIPFEFSEKI